MKILMTTFGCILLCTSLSGPVLAEPQPRMQQALKHLQMAKAQLKKASLDKGGHRVKALNHVRTAIAEVRKGIKFDNRH